MDERADMLAYHRERTRREKVWEASLHGRKLEIEGAEPTPEDKAADMRLRGHWERGGSKTAGPQDRAAIDFWMTPEA